MDKSMGNRLVCRGITRRFDSRILRNARDQGCFLWQRAAVNLAPCRGDTCTEYRAACQLSRHARQGLGCGFWGRHGPDLMRLLGVHADCADDFYRLRKLQSRTLTNIVLPIPLGRAGGYVVTRGWPQSRKVRPWIWLVLRKARTINVCSFHSLTVLETCSSQSSILRSRRGRGRDWILPSMARPKRQHQSKHVSRRVACQNGISSTAASLRLKPVVAVAQPYTRAAAHMEAGSIDRNPKVHRLIEKQLPFGEQQGLPSTSRLAPPRCRPPFPHPSVERETRKNRFKNMEKKNCLVCPFP